MLKLTKLTVGLTAALCLCGVSGCATNFDKSNSKTITRIAVVSPNNPSGIIDSDPLPNGAVYYPAGGGVIGAAIAGAARGYVEGLAAARAANEPPIEPVNLDQFLSDQKVALGTELADDVAAALRDEGYQIQEQGGNQSGESPDATLTLEIMRVGFEIGIDQTFSPLLMVKATLRNSTSSAVIYQRKYHYTGHTHSIWDEAIDADPKYTVGQGTLYKDHAKLLIEGIRAGAIEIAKRIAAALKTTHG